ncbi:MAG: helix-turn-helix domain-containing protein, partial [Spirochaetaceae bacterium]|nr:helix-turn-helix domain-containing protein [Spirochaetaceae bacterium]
YNFKDNIKYTRFYYHLTGGVSAMLLGDSMVIAYDNNDMSIGFAPEIAFALLLRNYRLNSNMTQKQVAEMLGMKNIYSYQRLEKRSNPTLTIINKIYTIFQEIKLNYLFQ